LQCQWHRGIWLKSNFIDFRVDFLGEYETICETVSSWWIRALGGIVWGKNRGLKISWHCPFKVKW
jgi:hypothetical protein